MKLHFFTTYPDTAPLLIVTTRPNTRVATHHPHVAPDGNVNLDLLRTWGRNTSLGDVIKEADRGFQNNVPLVYIFLCFLLMWNNV
jgi:ubiquitin-protein ligase